MGLLLNFFKSLTCLDPVPSSDPPVQCSRNNHYKLWCHHTSLSYCHTVILSHCHTVTLSYCHTVMLSLSHCHTVTLSLSHCHSVTLSHCHTVTLSHCPTVTLSHCHTVTLSYCHTVTLSLSHCHLMRWPIAWVGDRAVAEPLHIMHNLSEVCNIPDTTNPYIIILGPVWKCQTLCKTISWRHAAKQNTSKKSHGPYCVQRCCASFLTTTLTFSVHGLFSYKIKDYCCKKIKSIANTVANWIMHSAICQCVLPK